MTAESEAVLVGFAAALYSTVSSDQLATVEETEWHAVGQPITSLTENQARERLRRTGTGSWKP